MDFLDRWFPKGGLSGQPQVDPRQEAIDQYQKMLEQQASERVQVVSKKHQYGDTDSVSSSPAGPNNRTRGVIRSHHRPGRFTEGD